MSQTGTRYSIACGSYSKHQELAAALRVSGIDCGADIGCTWIYCLPEAVESMNRICQEVVGRLPYEGSDSFLKGLISSKCRQVVDIAPEEIERQETIDGFTLLLVIRTVKAEASERAGFMPSVKYKHQSDPVTMEDNGFLKSSGQLHAERWGALAEGQQLFEKHWSQDLACLGSMPIRVRTYEPPCDTFYRPAKQLAAKARAAASGDTASIQEFENAYRKAIARIELPVAGELYLRLELEAAYERWVNHQPWANHKSRWHDQLNFNKFADFVTELVEETGPIQRHFLIRRLWHSQQVNDFLERLLQRYLGEEGRANLDTEAWKYGLVPYGFTTAELLDAADRCY